jgi:hypothetical protein
MLRQPRSDCKGPVPTIVALPMPLAARASAGTSPGAIPGTIGLAAEPQAAAPSQALARIEGGVRRTRRVETMHIECPLQGDEGAFDAGQQKEAAQERQRQPDGQLNPDGRR